MAGPVDLQVTDRQLSVLAATKVIATRGDTLNTPTATITLSSPAEGIVRVRIDHHTGRRDPGPDFVLPGASEFRPVIEIDQKDATLRTGELTVRLRREGPRHLDFATGGRSLTGVDDTSIGLVTDPAGRMSSDSSTWTSAR